MSVHMRLAHLIPRASRSASTRGDTLGSPAFYDAFVNLFFFGRRRATYQRLIDAAGFQHGDRVLDVGCGTGYFARLLAKAVRTDGLVVGIDASEEMIGYASRHAADLGNCQFQLGTAESLPFPEEHFDAVVSTLFLHHLPADLQPTAFSEMRRVLRSGGIVLVADAQIPRAVGWRLLARAHGYDRMAQAVPQLERLASEVGFSEILSSEAPPWLRYTRAVKT